MKALRRCDACGHVFEPKAALLSRAGVIAFGLLMVYASTSMWLASFGRTGLRATVDKWILGPLAIGGGLLLLRIALRSSRK